MLQDLDFLLMCSLLNFLSFLAITNSFNISYFLPDLFKVKLNSTSPIQTFLHTFPQIEWSSIVLGQYCLCILQYHPMEYDHRKCKISGFCGEICNSTSPIQNFLHIFPQIAWSSIVLPRLQQRSEERRVDVVW